MTINDIKNSINAWNAVRSTDLGLTLLTSGYAIELSSQEFDKWYQRLQGKEGITIHLYIGVEDLKIQFYLVDSETDKNETYSINENLFIKGFPRKPIESSDHPNIKHLEIDETTAVSRIFKWFFTASGWFNNQVINQSVNGNEGVVRVFKIPFGDFSVSFKEGQKKALILFGIRDYKDANLYDQIEVLVCSVLNGKVLLAKGNLGFADVTSPHPPFSMSSKQGFNLFKPSE